MIAAERITVCADRVKAWVRVDPADAVMTPARAARVVGAFPDLPRHACVNAEGETFAAVIDHTSLPHVLEHLVIDLQVRSSDEPATIFTGTTEWVDRANGEALVQVSFRDDLIALRAFSEALSFLNRAVVE